MARAWPVHQGRLDKLREVTPRDDKGHLKHKLFQRLMPDAGVPALREHLASVTTIMKLADEWQRFMNKLDRVHPRFNTTLLLPFNEGEAEPPRVRGRNPYDGGRVSEREVTEEVRENRGHEVPQVQPSRLPRGRSQEMIDCSARHLGRSPPGVRLTSCRTY